MGRSSLLVLGHTVAKQKALHTSARSSCHPTTPLTPPAAVLPTERPKLDELTLERVLEELETLCHQNMARAIETQEGLGIEYDEDVVCDVCRSPEGEDGNEMVFCDKCNVCVHQVGGLSSLTWW